MVDTTLLRCLAILLIANSHLERLYPVPWLAADGLLGNSLFFLLPGFGLALSPNAGTQPFLDWYWRRITRIYPTVLVVVLALPLLVEQRWQVWSLTDYLRWFIYPTKFLFISQILVFYIAIYFLIKLERKQILLACIVLLFIPYFAIYAAERSRVEGAPLRLGEVSIWLHAAFYLQITLFGVYLGSRVDRLPRPTSRHASILSIACGLYLGVKLAMVKGIGSDYFFLLHFAIFPIAFYALVVSRSPFLDTRERATPLLWSPVAFFGGLTLEIYTIHEFVYPRLEATIFPLNIVVFWLVTLALAYPTRIVATLVRDRLRDFVPSKFVKRDIKPS